MRVSATGLTAERFRMDVIAANIANANTIGINGQEPYRRRNVVLETEGDAVSVREIAMDPSALPTRYEPGNPNADAHGNVVTSNVQPVIEMVDMMSANRAYEANITAFKTAKSMIEAALDIGRA